MVTSLGNGLIADAVNQDGVQGSTAKAIAAKPDGLHLILGTHMLGARELVPTSYPMTSALAPAHMHTLTTYETLKRFFKI